MKALKYALIQLVRIAPIPFVAILAFMAWANIGAIAEGRDSEPRLMFIIAVSFLIAVWAFLYYRLKPLAKKYAPGPPSLHTEISDSSS